MPLFLDEANATRPDDGGGAAGLFVRAFDLLLEQGDVAGADAVMRGGLAVLPWSTPLLRRHVLAALLMGDEPLAAKRAAEWFRRLPLLLEDFDALGHAVASKAGLGVEMGAGWRPFAARSVDLSLHVHGLLQAAQRHDEYAMFIAHVAERFAEDPAILRVVIRFYLREQRWVEALQSVQRMPIAHRFEHWADIASLSALAFGFRDQPRHLATVIDVLLDETAPEKWRAEWMPGIVETLVDRRNDLALFIDGALPLLESRLRDRERPVDRHVLLALNLLLRRDGDDVGLMAEGVGELMRRGMTRLLFTLVMIEYPERRDWGIGPYIRQIWPQLLQQHAAGPVGREQHAALLAMSWVFDAQAFRALAAGPGGALLALARAPAQSVPPLPAPPSPSGRLRVALLIGGQLRGFEKAAPTLGRLGLGAHETSTFVSTWRRIGNNKAVFSGGFGDATPTLNERLGELRLRFNPQELVERFPWTSALGGDVSEARLREVYGTDHILIENEMEVLPPGSSNQSKFLWKIRSAFGLAEGDFDLFVFLRPDRSVQSGNVVDWPVLARRARQERLLFCELGGYFHGGRRLFVGDQFAAGDRCVMQCMADSYSLPEFVRGHPDTEFAPPHHEQHQTIAGQLFHSGVVATTTPGLRLGGLEQPSIRLTAAEVLLAMRSDMARRTPDQFDRDLLAAIEADLAKDCYAS